MRFKLDPLSPTGVSVDSSSDTKVINRQSHGYIGTGVKKIIAGTNVIVNDSDPANPIVSATGGGGGGDAVWGGIAGTLSDQTDLQSELDGKASLSGAVFTGDVESYGSITASNLTGDQLNIEGAGYANIGSGGVYSVGDITTEGDIIVDGLVDGVDVAALETTVNGIVQDVNVVHPFTASSSVTVNHNLNKMPSVTIIDSANDEVEGQVTHSSVNSLTVNFSSSFTGTIILN